MLYQFSTYTDKSKYTWNGRSNAPQQLGNMSSCSMEYQRYIPILYQIVPKTTPTGIWRQVHRHSYGKIHMKSPQGIWLISWNSIEIGFNFWYKTQEWASHFIIHSPSTWWFYISQVLYICRSCGSILAQGDEFLVLLGSLAICLWHTACITCE